VEKVTLQPAYNGRVNDPLEPGLDIQLRGVRLVIAELFLGQREQLEKAGVLARAMKSAEELKAGGPHLMQEVYQAMAEIAVVALQTNYPDMTIDIVKENFSHSRLIRVLNFALTGEMPGPSKGAVQPAGEPVTALPNGPTSMVS